MARLELIDSGILFINADPAHYHVFASHAHPVQLSAQEFIATYQRGDGMYATNANMALSRSLDGGVTWTSEGFLHDKVGDEQAYSYHDGFLSQLRDGTLIVFAFRANRIDPTKPMFSPSGGLIENEPVLLFSQDGGHTWTKPQPIQLPPGLVATPASTIVELADGRWLATFDQWHSYDDDRPYKPIMLACFSADRGQTWSEMTVMADGAPEGKGFWHGKTIRLNDDRLFTLYWAADMTQPDKGAINLPIHYAITDKAGVHWPMPQPTSIIGQTNWPAQLPDGKIAAIYTLRESDQPGFLAVLSEDGGQTWDLEHQVRLWDATGWTHIGISAPDKYPRSHDTIAFGAPTLMTTLEGELYASWWCTYASITHVRWARLRVVD
ncbi:MAG: sialidase family protein [Chloroflexi bacterium]|nr:sialidase family protein [Chloroflexota bacterium]